MEHYNGKICVSYSDLVEGNPTDSNIAMRPILTDANYRFLTQKNKLNVLRRACYGTPALIEYQSIPVRFKERIIAKYGNPEDAAKSYVLKDMIIKDLKAEHFFSQFTFDGVEYLSDAKQKEYTMNASALNTIARLVSDRTMLIKALNGNTKCVWNQVSVALNQIQKKIGCNLPENHLRLKDKVLQYQSGGYDMLISRKFGNQAARKVKENEQDALIQELLGNGRNIDNETVANLYNMVALKMSWPTVTAGTIANYRKETELVTYAGRHGKSAHYNEKAMQVKRTKPTLPMLYWCVDGWDAELLYKDTAKNKDGIKITTYHKRPTVVMIVDPFNLYPIGYAIGTHETPALIRQAFRNAFEHTHELFGTYYKPWQLQTDNYGNGNLASFYEACTTYYTPAKAHNAKAKVIEPFFDKFNRKYLRLCPNSSGFGVKSRSGIQPSSDFLNQQKKDFPDFAGCVAQLDSMIQLDRREKQEAYMAKWAAVADQDKCPLSLADYLNLFGETTGRVNRLQHNGVVLTIDRTQYAYDCFDLKFREYGHSSFILKYDPSFMNQVLAIENIGTDNEPIEGVARFLLVQKYLQPMALRDRKAGDMDELQKIRDFNEKFDNHIIETRKEKRKIVEDFFDSNADILSDTLAKHVLTDSVGRHKDRRNELAGRSTPISIQAPEVEDEEFNIVYDRRDFLNSI